MHMSDSAMSLGTEQLVTLAGTLTSFAEAAEKILPTMTGLRVSESTTERTTERIGAVLGKQLAQGRIYGESQLWAWTQDAEGKTCAFIGADLTGVGMQGPGGVAADGRMAAVAMIWNARDENHRGGEVRYVSGLTGGLAALGLPLRRQGAQVGMDQADRWIAISDGGAGIEDWFRENFGRVEAVILDFFHAAEHLHQWTRAWHPQDDEAAQTLASHWCHRLKHEGGAVVLEALRQMDVAHATPLLQNTHRELLVYFENQVHRMEYPTYRKKGWLIGSGPVEAACKQVVGARLKGTGMRWSEPGADAVCHLRALFRSQARQWKDFWASLAA